MTTACISCMSSQYIGGFFWCKILPKRLAGLQEEGSWYQMGVIRGILVFCHLSADAGCCSMGWIACSIVSAKLRLDQTEQCEPCGCLNTKPSAEQHRHLCATAVL